MLLAIAKKQDFQFAEDINAARRSTLSSQELLALVLRNFYNIKDFEIIKDIKGKPFLKNSKFHISISHTVDLVAVCVSNCNIGLDLERVHHRKSFDLLINKVCKENEKEYLLNLNKEQQDSFFISLWTIKEALVKYSGIGLSDLESINTFYNRDKIIYDKAINSKVNTYFLNHDVLNTNLNYYLSVVSTDKENDLYFWDKDRNATFRKLSLPKTKSFLVVPSS